ncbi:Hypothetical_protein [Hexamita inflata]|uniref:Hypothetical_protein n=1 Tax=Hexamita inflata TaxID=28002 RepID=A0AA86R5E1_9EUKA|nr:Hypothetical protein HINF_LOCUS53874 [Hexamita inflata]
MSKLLANIFSIDRDSFRLSALPTINSLIYTYYGENDDPEFEDLVQMINQLNSSQSQEFWEIMSQIHGCDSKHLQEYYTNLQKTQLIQEKPSQSFSALPTQSNASNSDMQLMQTNNAKQSSEKVLKAKNDLKNALIHVVKEINRSIPDSISDRELCVLVNNIVDNDATQQFWNRVAAQVRSKTKKQLYDFYHTSFSKALYDSNITKEDKALIEQLNQEQPERKPAELAQTFLEQTGRNVLKHNVVMCFVNIRRYASKQRQSAAGKAE